MKNILQGKCILIAEDEPDLLEVYADTLQMFGATVHCASNGKDGYGILCREKVDLIISDIRMPGGDGITFLRQVRERNLAEPPFLFVSGYSELSETEAKEQGAYAMLAKPLFMAALVEAATQATLSCTTNGTPDAA